MFITAFVLVSAIATATATAAPPQTQAKPQTAPMVTEADRPQMRAILAALHSMEAEALRKFDRHEMTKKDLQGLRDLTMGMNVYLPRNCFPTCEAGMTCCNGTCIEVGQSCTTPFPPCREH